MIQMNPSDNLKIIKQSLDYIWNSQLSTAFQNKSLLKKILILAFDDSKLYILTKIPLEIRGIKSQQFFNDYNLYIIKHNISLKNNDFCGWRSCINKKEFLKYLPQQFVKTSQLSWPRISGPVATLFFDFHKKLKKQKRIFDPYTTKESFLATIIHEFGHAYFYGTYLPWHGFQKQNLAILKTALSLFSGKKVTPKTKIAWNSFVPPNASEIYAFCTEYYASTVFFPNHKKAIDREMEYFLPKLIREEKKKDLNFQASILDLNQHLSSAIFGKLIISQLGSSWPNFFSPYT